MKMHNNDVAELFDRLADLLEIEGANPFRVRAYRNAARLIRSLPRDVADMVAAGEDLTRLPGIGEDLAGKIKTIVETGTLPLLEEEARKVPPELAELLEIEGLGPKRVKVLHEVLGVRSLEDLERAVNAGKVRELPGFGEKTEKAILEGIQRLRAQYGRMLLATAESIAEALREHLAATSGVERVEIAGSYRRRKETVGDLDILAIAAPDSPVMDRFTTFEAVARVQSKGTTRSTVHLRSGLQVDLRVVAPQSYGAALQYFTGSKAHNIAVRRLAVKRGLKINEYGIFRGSRRIGGAEEKEVYASVDLPWIPPELREDRGEIEAAMAGRLPDLITQDHIRGDLHVHSKHTDGRYSIEDMARAARDLGYEYIAVTDHSRRVAMAHGLDEKRLRQELEEIDRLNERLEGIRILKGCEVDILEDGRLDLPDSVLAELDLTVCSVHYRFNLPREKQTARILRAMDNPYFTILGHPTGRLINERDPYDVDLDRIIRHAAERGAILELNAQPSRLDLTDTACQQAKELGVKIAISTDAHTVHDLRFMRYGIDQARRGWLEAGDVVNTLPLNDLLDLMAKTRHARAA